MSAITVSGDIYKWLQTVKLVKDGKKAQQNKIQLTPQNSEAMKVGNLFGKVFEAALKNQQNSKDILANIQTLKQNPTPAIRLYNWNILIEALKRVGHIIDPETKKRILESQSEPVNEALAFLYEKFVAKETSKDVKPLQIDINTVSAKKPLNECRNILEFTVVSLAKNLKLSPQHALNLFLENNKYLAHLLVKGVKGSYDPILDFLEDMLTHGEYIVLNLFTIEQKDSVQFLFNVLKPALISKDFGVAEKTLRVFDLFQKIYLQNPFIFIPHFFYLPSMIDSQKHLDFAIPRQWVLDEGVNSFMFSLKRHDTLVKKCIQTMLAYAEDKLFPFVSPVAKSSLWTDNKEHITFFLSFLQTMESPILQVFESSSQMEQWIKLLTKTIEAPEKDIRTKSILAFEKMWLIFPKFFQEHQKQLPNVLIGGLKNAALEQDEISAYSAISVLFSLKTKLGNERNSYAPYIYKTLINTFSFSASNQNKLAYITENFKMSFKILSNLPAGPLLTPLLNLMQTAKPNQNMMEICQIMVDLNRLTVLQLMQVIDVMIKIAYGDIVFGQMAIQILRSSLDSVQFDDDLAGMTLRVSKLGLSMFYSHHKKARPLYEIRREAEKKNDKMNKHALDDGKLYRLMTNTTKVLALFLSRFEQIVEKMEIFIAHTYLQLKKDTERHSKLLYDLLLINRDDIRVKELLKPLQENYEDPTEKQINDKNIEASSMEVEGASPVIDRSRIKSMMNSRADSSLDADSSMPNSATLPAEIDPSTLKPTRRALKGIQDALTKRKHLKQKSEQKLHMSILQSDKLNKMLKSAMEKRHIQVGISKKKDEEINCIFEWESIKEISDTSAGVQQIKLVDIPNQQNFWEEGIDSIMKRYRKVWRFLFFKYSSSGSKNKDASAAFKTEEKIHLAEVWKMIRDYNISTHIRKQELTALLRAINDSRGKNGDLQNMTYLGFEEFIVQFCILNYSKPEEGFTYASPSRQLMEFLNRVKKVTAQRNGSIELFENPENVYLQEGEVIRQFNQRLEENPNYILPEGFKKVKEVQVHFDQSLERLSDFNKKTIKQSYIIGFEILSDLFFSEFGVNLFEPVTHKTQIYRAKPVLFQNINQKLKDYKKGYLLPRRNTIATSPAKSLIKQIDPTEFHPLVRFSPGIKLGLALVNVKYRYIADQVAYWMDDMLDAIEKGEKKVGNKAKKQIQNPILKLKKQKLDEQKKALREYEKKFHSRDSKLKSKLIQQKEEAEKKKKEQLDRKKQLKKIQAQKQKEKEELAEKIKEKIQKKKQEELEEKQFKETEEKKRKEKQKEVYKKQVEQYFEKKKEEVKNMEEEMKRKKKEEAEQKEQEEKQIKEKQDKLYVSILKKDEGVLTKVVDLKSVYTEAWNSESIQQVYTNYQTQLSLLFQLLLKYEKSKISATSFNEISANTYNFFAVKFNVVPLIVNKNGLSQVFRSFMKEEQSAEERKGMFGLDYPKFKQSLFKICAKGKEVLNSLVDRKFRESELKGVEESPEKIGGKEAPDLVYTHQYTSALKGSPQKRNLELANEYIFDTNDVNSNTLEQLIKFLHLPKDKLGMDERFRQVIESKTIKPIPIKSIESAQSS